MYVGGGTPTILPPAELARLLDAARVALHPRAQIEFTVEANPAAVSPWIAEVLAQAGVNRVSIGAQSFDPAQLGALERTHTPPQVAGTLEICRQHGVRYKNVPDTAAYVEAVLGGSSPWVDQERLTPQRRARETAMLELRLTEGIDRRRFRERFGQDPASFFAHAVKKHGDLRLLEADEHAIRLTRAGLLLADLVIADFL